MNLSAVVFATLLGVSAHSDPPAQANPGSLVLGAPLERWDSALPLGNAQAAESLALAEAEIAAQNATVTGHSCVGGHRCVNRRIWRPGVGNGAIRHRRIGRR